MELAKKGWKVAAVGELMVCRPFSMYTEPEFLAIKERLDAADVGYGHLEMNFHDQDNIPCPSRGDWVGSFMNADPVVAKDIKWFGVDIMSLANNHSFDFGTEGIIQNRKHCIDAGIACAGTGRDLEEAGSPAIYESPRGRVALISTTSGNRNFEWASLSKATIPARPGVNPLRVHTRFHVTEDVANALKKMGRELKILATKGTYIEGDRLSSEEFAVGAFMENTKYSGHTYVVDNKFYIEMYNDKKDLERIIREVKNTRKTSDLIMIAHHFNVSEGPRGDEPPAFARDFAHAAIDAGADMYFGHGWHRTLGIEIYKGKPIIYGMGNIFAQTQFLRKVPYDSFEVWNHDIDRLPTLMSYDEPLHPGLDLPSPLWWSSAIYEYEFDENRNIKSIKLTPVELGRDYSETEVIITRHTGEKCEGRPMIAHGENARLILERFRKLSRLYGTEITIEGDVGYWHA